MAQIQTGTCEVTSGDASVISSPGNDWSLVKAGHWFSVLNIVYTIAADAVFDVPSSTWSIALTAPYAGADDAAAIYSIHKDFEPLFGFPTFTPGDTQTASLINRSFSMMAAAMLNSGLTGATAQLVANADWVWDPTRTTVMQSLALTADRNATLPSAAAFLSGSRILYSDTKTSGSLGFGVIFSPAAGQTLNGAGGTQKPVVGGGQATFISDGAGNWDLLNQHQYIVSLQDGTDPSKKAHFDLTPISPGADRVIHCPDADVTLGTGGGGGGTSTDYNLQATPPATPASGVLRIYAAASGGKRFLRKLSDFGLDSSLQISLWERQIILWQPTPSATGHINLGSVTQYGGTPTDPALINTNFYTLLKRKAHPVAAGANLQCGIAFDDAICLRAAGVRSGGFFFFCRFGFEALTTNCRMFIGLTATAHASILTVNPSTMINCAGFGYDQGDTAISFIHGDATGGPTKTAIAGTTLAVNRAYDCWVYMRGGGDNNIYYQLDDLIPSPVVTLVNTSLAADVPTSAAQMRPVVLMGSGSNTTAGIVSLGICRWYCEMNS